MLKNYKPQIFILGIILVVTLVFSFTDTTYIRKISEESTEKFLSGVSTQRTEAIIHEINYETTKLKEIARLLEEFRLVNAEARMEGYLERKVSLMEFDALLIVKEDGACVSKKAEEKLVQSGIALSEITGIEKALRGESAVDCLNQEMLVYTVPVYNGQEVAYALCAVCPKKNTLFSAQKSIFEKSSAVLVDSYGNLVLSLQDSGLFGNVGGLLTDGEQTELQAMLDRSTEEDETNYYWKKSADGKRMLAAYHPIGVNDWFLQTLIPENLLTGISKDYTVRMRLTILLILSIFLGFLFIIRQTYETGRRELTRKMFVDEVTEGMNNAAFRKRYRETFGRNEVSGYAIILLNARDFKLVNEKFGMETGDLLLRYSLKAITKNLREEDQEFAARGELDHFFLCIKEQEERAIQERIDQIVKDINAVWQAAGKNHAISFWQAGYILENEAMDIGKIQDRVRAALQRQRMEMNTNCIFYNQDILKKIRRDHQLESMFQNSLENGDFEMYLQPKVQVGSWKVKGAEALVRWKHPKEGMIYPNEFIPLFEQNGKIQEIDRYIYEEACKFLARRQKEGKELFIISVNLSRNHFQNADFLDFFIETADRYQVPRNFLEFELTERICLDDNGIEMVKNSMCRMHEAGFHCSIDDFGTGYSSLGLLREFEIDVLKLDRLFFENLSDRKSRNIVKCIVELAKALNVQTVAEGIETRQQLEDLHETPCDLIQGYLFSKPLSVCDFENWEQTFDVTAEQYRTEHKTIKL